MANQLSFASLEFAAKKKRTKRDVFLGEMAAVVPWGVLTEKMLASSPLRIWWRWSRGPTRSLVSSEFVGKASRLARRAQRVQQG